ncbi:unnamed protein product [Candida verbasci]|uniref:Transcription factor CBF/NF-Y/archaeal histone domain-containing protein n=1 Tax=Candida verbasci TaxID=1227364 RepID=A0A9W4XG90_9ASCO|nr:unnamed protein product [Candida verbasci]
MSQESTTHTTPLQISNTTSPQPENGKTVVHEDVEMVDAETAATSGSDLSLPLSKIKKIFKMDPEYQGASQSAVYTTGLATELFVQYLTEQANLLAKMEKRKKIQYKDFANCIQNHDSLQFLTDTIPKTQPIGDLINEKKVNLLKEQDPKQSKTKAPKESNNVPVQKELETGQQTLPFIAEKPIKKAGINDLVG